MRIHALLYLFVSVSVLALVLLLIALAPTWQAPPKQLILPYNDVKGMAVESGGVLYTLNFDQQKQVVAALNRGTGLPDMEMYAPSVEKLIIYRFNASEWVIPVSRMKNDTVN